MRILDLVKSAEKQLRAAGVESTHREAEWLLAAILQTDRANLYLMRERRLKKHERAQFEEFLNRRLAREPLQYILGVCEFYGFEFAVTPAVLIPRPETELLVEKVVELAAQFDSPRIIDLGTGSGCIAVSLAKLIANAHVIATDVSTMALEIAQANAKKLGVANRIEFRLADMTKSNSDEQFDLVVSNPPYVLETERPSLQPEVRDWEPAEALYVKDDGLKFYRCIIDYCKDHLRSGGWVACEMASQRSTAIEKLFREAGFHEVQIINDLAGFERHIIGQK
ncbi:MAG: peptide chain release factor N(5)-glutamine methyltransferase [candidate division KSB1 bacterium]|nr:peptide chain release factor N(5)-glutamine methyltransferase [candidate division KSB1 bacterium]MDZ7366330.1 peptide chain release factor N(5)-glutamine methyltransferase [candidate division KSB1 bacterium]MDZ7403985.1 peptide chain release factor N(5)-glutamine methyltransferase [candidate division KSB1 bacterium]